MFTQIASVLSLIAAISAWSPTDSYAPGLVSCPAKSSLVREARGLSDDEANWLEERHKITDVNLVDFLTRANMTDFDAADFIDGLNRSINVGVSFSGGGYRAMLCGAGQFSALDNRTNGSAESGLGGLMQAATYLTGLSGGNWLVGSIIMNNWTDIDTILEDGVIWDLDHSIITPGGIDIFDTISVWDDISDDIDRKRDAGFNITLTDPWGRALSHQFFAGLDDAGAALLWSDLRNYDAFTSHEMPFPVVVSDGRYPNSVILNQNSTVFEIGPYELGSWDPALYAFTDTKYLGSNVTAGSPNSNSCVAGFDNAGYIMGTSSTLFNQFILQINTTGLSGVLLDLVDDFLDDLSEDQDDIAVYHPNPFYQTEFGNSDNLLSSDTLYLVDGGEDLQNIPLVPLIQPVREVDVIFAFDNSADTNSSWPDGASLVATYERQFGSQGNGTAFPYVPDINTFVNNNLTAKPTFFGCDASNMTDLIGESGFVPPLIVYIANRPFDYWSNTSTFKLSYSEDEKRGMITNGFEVASRYNLTLDPEWPACVGCAIIRREQERLGLEQSEQCQRCFEDYCWDGTLDSDTALPLNFTLNGTTNGPESTGNRTSGGVSLFDTNGKRSVYIYMLLALSLFIIF